MRAALCIIGQIAPQSKVIKSLTIKWLSTSLPFTDPEPGV